ncbi:MAG: hypothetical protein HQ500_00965 [Flavobacteriales bacterium]|nr:hypothetical protein [Flavobacteriales bacterium]
MKRIVMSLVAMVFLGQLANAQIRTYTANEEDSVSCIQNLSLYIEYFKQDNFTDALPGWRKATSICPKATESLWINGIKLFQGLAEEESDPVLKEKLLDTLFWIYDQRIEHFGRSAGKEGYILGRKGSDMIKYRSNDPKAAFDVLQKSLELQKNDMEAGASIYLYKAAYDMYRAKLTEKEMLFDLYDQLGSAVDFNIANQTDARMKSAFETALANIDKMVGSVANCEELIAIFGAQYEANPNDIDLLHKIVKLLGKQECDDSDLYQNAAVGIHEANPTPESAYDIAMSFYKKKNYSKAFAFYKEAVAGSQDNDLLFKSYKYGANCLLQLGQAQSAKGYALKMLNIDPNSGDAYMLIGQAYVQGRKECGSNECEGRAAYWAAVDKFAKAKSVDPSVADEAQKLINSYSAQFPKKEDCFFHGINEGTTYTFDCWIGETTTVRTRDN